VPANNTKNVTGKTQYQAKHTFKTGLCGESLLDSLEISTEQSITITWQVLTLNQNNQYTEHTEKYKITQHNQSDPSEHQKHSKEIYD